MLSFDLTEDLMIEDYHLLLITHSLPHPALSSTIILEIVSFASGGWGSYCHLFRLYVHRVDRMQERFDLHHKCFLAAPPRQAICFHFLTVL